MSTQNEVRQKITDQIIAALSDGTKLPPWRKPWRTDANAGHPTNVVSKRGYTGVNPLLLDIATNALTQITFSGTGTCTAAKPGANLACPVQILVDGQATGKVNILPSTASSPTPVPVASTILKTTVLTKGGHTVQLQYPGAKDVTFTLKTWDLAVEAFPLPDETEETDSSK